MAIAMWHHQCVGGTRGHGEGDGTMTKTYIERYQSIATALEVVSRRRGYAAILGDDDTVWVVTLATAEKLARQGFSWA